MADAILDDIASASGATVDQLARKATVSIAAISRCAGAVDCDDTRDLKLKLARASAVGGRFLAGDVPEESTFCARLVRLGYRVAAAHFLITASSGVGHALSGRQRLHAQA
ncbi:MAG: hypothetical protein ACTHJ1_09350 [Bordetella sp.]|uniref:hypothetical protein n=1 Tax=Bordetella sp. TaxID=28081 RepID=UPI003F7B9764